MLSTYCGRLCLSSLYHHVVCPRLTDLYLMHACSTLTTRLRTCTAPRMKPAHCSSGLSLKNQDDVEELQVGFKLRTPQHSSRIITRTPFSFQRAATEDEVHQTSQSCWMFEYVCEHDRMGGRWVSTVLCICAIVERAGASVLERDRAHVAGHRLSRIRCYHRGLLP